MSALQHCRLLHGSVKQAASSSLMQPASSYASLRNSARLPSSIYATINSDEHGEVFDERGKPLCIMPKSEILSQGLHSRGVAVLVMSPANFMLLACKEDAQFDVTCHDLVSAGMETEEYAELLLERKLGVSKQLRLISTLAVDSIQYSFFRATLSDAFVKAREDANFLLAQLDEMPELGRRQLISRMLGIALEEFSTKSDPPSSDEDDHL